MTKLVKNIFVVSLIGSVAFAAPTAEKKFNSADINNDNIITSEEFYNDQAKKMEQKVKEGRALKGASTAPQFVDVDVNKDGKVTFKEYNLFHTIRQKKMNHIKNKSKGRGNGKGRNNK